MGRNIAVIVIQFGGKSRIGDLNVLNESMGDLLGLHKQTEERKEG